LLKSFALAIILSLGIFGQQAWCGSPSSPMLPSGLKSNSSSSTKPSSGNLSPKLPSDLKSNDSPALTGGLKSGESPSLPGGLKNPLEAEEKNQKPETDQKTGTFNFLDSWNIEGFGEVRYGARLQEDKNEDNSSIREARHQLEMQKHFKNITVNIKSDIVFDTVIDEHELDLEKGYGPIDLREANLSFSPYFFLDVKIGRQILTWGTGDMLFINDMFPKDWPSFFIGRDDEYLKAPSDALYTAFFSDFANLTVVYTPVFDADRYVSGDRISYYSGVLGERVGRNAVIETEKPDEWFKDDEFAVRLKKTVSGWEFAAYGYWGYWKSPAGIDPQTQLALFPELNVYGMSILGPVYSGVANLEVGYYDSKDDPDGDDLSIKNSQWRCLFGYTRDFPKIARDFSIGLQYYLEVIDDYSAYESSLSEDSILDDEFRHVITLRLTKQLMNQNLILSFFSFYSPSDEDFYFRPVLHYKIDDHWTAIVGGNIFTGEQEHTFFGQFEKNSNIYAGIKYGFN
jgi:hypothetical protein